VLPAAAPAGPSGQEDGKQAPDTKRRNPEILPIDVPFRTVKDSAGKERVAKYQQLDGLQAGLFLYQIDLRNQRIEALVHPGDRGGAAPPQFVRHNRARRMVVFTATFPYREQLEVYRKALRVEKADDLFAKGLAPRLAGLNVARRTRRPNKTWSDWESVYLVDKREGKVVARKATHDLLTTAEYDESTLKRYGHLLVPTCASPLPALAYAEYPPLQLEGIQARTKAPTTPAGDAEKIPPVKKPATPETPAFGFQRPVMMIKPIPLRSLDRSFAMRLHGNGNPFSPSGTFPEDLEEKEKAGKAKEPTVRMSPNGKVLVRFLDADVQPGQTYQYQVQVRMENPNYGKPREVAFAALAEVKELVSPWTMTGTVTLPTESYFYVVDQQPPATPAIAKAVATTASAKVLKSRTGIDTRAPRSDEVPFQLHQWVDRVLVDDDAEVAAWMIAERLLFRRGDLISRPNVEVPVPMWDYHRDAFVLGVAVARRKGPKGLPQPAYQYSLPVNFPLDDTGAFVLADFYGRDERPAGKFDEGNVEVLLIGPDGGLVVRSSHQDSDPASARGGERLQRYRAWLNRLERFLR
jgi:hypothetical protein